VPKVNDDRVPCSVIAMTGRARSNACSEPNRWFPKPPSERLAFLPASSRRRPAPRAEESLALAKGVAEFGVVAVQENVGSQRDPLLRPCRAALLIDDRSRQGQQHRRDDDPHAPNDTPRASAAPAACGRRARAGCAAHAVLEGAWHFEADASAAFELWNYNISHEDLFGLTQSVTYGVGDGFALRGAQRFLYVSQRGEDGVLLGLTIGVRRRVGRPGRVTGFLQGDLGISYTGDSRRPAARHALQLSGDRRRRRADPHVPTRVHVRDDGALDAYFERGA
jgi:hypothetical protein